jgi:Suppressor of fused protein (SUFU)
MMIGLTENEMEAIQRHVEVSLGPVAAVLHDTSMEDPHVDVLVIPPTAERKFVVLVSMGMSFNRTVEAPSRIASILSKLLFVPKSNDRQPLMELFCKVDSRFWNAESGALDEIGSTAAKILIGLAKYPYVEKTKLEAGHTVGGGLIPAFFAGSEINGMWVAASDCLGERFAILQDGSNSIQFNSLRFVLPREMEFALEHGVGALEDQFAKNGVDSDLLLTDRKSPVGN